MCAGTVVEPPGETSAAVESVTSRSRSVAFRLNLPRSAFTRTLARIGMVLRRSTTRWTWTSDFKSSARSTVTFMKNPLRRPRNDLSNQAQRQAGARGMRSRGAKVAKARVFRKGAFGARWHIPRRPQPSTQQKGPARTVNGALSPIVGASLFLQLPFQNLDFLRKGHVVADQAFDLTHRVEDRRVIATADTAGELRQRPQGQGLCEVHRDLSWPHDIRGASRRQQVGTAHIILARHDPLDVLDLDPLRFLRTDQVAHLALGHFERHGMAGELVMGEQAIERTFEIAAIVGDSLRNIAKHRQGHVEGRVMRARSQNARLENFKSQLFAERPHLHEQYTREPRANAIIEALEIGRRAIGGDDHLTTGVDQRVER